ncbi:hypothetical protein WJ968_27100 [Achromobacter xylosoxidans]
MCWAATSGTQGRGIDVTAIARPARERILGLLAGAACSKAGRDAALSGTLAADGDLKLQAGGAASNDGQLLSSTGKLQLYGGDATLKGSLRSNGDLTAWTQVSWRCWAPAQRRALNLTSVGDPSIGKHRHGPSGRCHRPAHAR